MPATTSMTERSVITCPGCGTAKAERMPIDACQIVYQCTGCGMTLRPKPGDCCVFCSYGSVPCPPIQAEHSLNVRAPRGACDFVAPRCASHNNCDCTKQLSLPHNFATANSSATPIAIHPISQLHYRNVIRLGQ